MKAWKKDAYAWRHDGRVQMHESMIPKIDKKSRKKSPTLDRKNWSRGQTEKKIKS